MILQKFKEIAIQYYEANAKKNKLASEHKKITKELNQAEEELKRCRRRLLNPDLLENENSRAVVINGQVLVVRRKDGEAGELVVETIQT